MVFLWSFASDVLYFLRMEQSLCIIYILVAVLAEKWLNAKLSTVVGSVLVIFVLFNSVTANIFYYYMQRCNHRNYALATEMSTRIHELDDGTVKKIAIGGELEAWYYTFDDQLEALGLLRVVNKNILIDQKLFALYFENELGFKLSYYEMNKNAEIPCRNKAKDEPVPENWKFAFPVVSDDELEKICESKQYIEMPCWPASDSIRVIDDVIVVKLSTEKVN